MEELQITINNNFMISNCLHLFLVAKVVESKVLLYIKSIYLQVTDDDMALIDA